MIIIFINGLRDIIIVYILKRIGYGLIYSNISIFMRLIDVDMVAIKDKVIFIKI